MISYSPLWKTMKEKGVTQYMLIRHYHVSAGQIGRLKQNRPVSTKTIETLCRILECNVEEVIQILNEG